MDKITQYKKAIKEILEVLASRIPVNRPTLKKHLVIDDAKNEYILVSLGPNEVKYYYNVLVHLEIKDGKILIHEENIDPTIYERLMDKGIAEKDIVPVYLQNYA
jgi:XisI protein